ncbi:disease resistance protein At4g27190-like [Tasmannia lanceolata]|uniref:disease resistance protein At4g27190-like n=1 Tax=Tasmannia lanceolata TaxID=3420 RepID=UPI004062F45F
MENKRCFEGWCPNFSSRYSLGREATKKMVDVDGLLARGDFTHVSTPRPCPSFNPAGEFEAFESTESAKKLVIKALKEERINIIGVYGMGGVGKTTLVEQVGKQAKDEKLCDEVVKKKIEVQVLPEQDSWNLFKEKAEVVETNELQSLAREVAKECKGLPLAIVTVARALSGKGSSIWANALQELKRSSPRNIEGVDKEVYSRLEMSYNYIGSEEAKLCFLFCCVFPEDHNIKVGLLMRYRMGERVFNCVNNFEKAWNRIHT